VLEWLETLTNQVLSSQPKKDTLMKLQLSVIKKYICQILNKTLQHKELDKPAIKKTSIICHQLQRSGASFEVIHCILANDKPQTTP
jgi:hypothetical protein